MLGPLPFFLPIIKRKLNQRKAGTSSSSARSSAWPPAPFPKGNCSTSKTLKDFGPDPNAHNEVRKKYKLFRLSETRWVRWHKKLGTGPPGGLVSQKVCEFVNGVKTIITPDSGSGRTARDRETVARNLIGLGKNPNVAGVILHNQHPAMMSEELKPELLAQEIAKTGKPVEVISSESYTDSYDLLVRGIKAARNLVRQASFVPRREVGDQHLCIGGKCGVSDATSGMAGFLCPFPTMPRPLPQAPHAGRSENCSHQKDHGMLSLCIGLGHLVDGLVKIGYGQGFGIFRADFYAGKAQNTFPPVNVCDITDINGVFRAGFNTDLALVHFSISVTGAKATVSLIFLSMCRFSGSL